MKNSNKEHDYYSSDLRKNIPEIVAAVAVSLVILGAIAIIVMNGEKIDKPF